MADDSLFIVVEGMDGSGKTGITRQLRAILSQTHKDHVALTFEPHDPSAAGLFIRNVLTKRIKVNPITLALAFALNRADHNARIIEPFLSHKQPRIIISDRYTLSSLVYQSTDGLTMEDVYQLNQWARRPDFTIFLNVSPRNCYERMRNRPQDRELFEKNLKQRFKKYQAGMALLREKGETVLEVDANPTFPEVLSNVLDTVKVHAPDWLKIQPPLIVEEADAMGSDLPYISDDDLNTWVKTLNSSDVENLSYTDCNRLFKAYVIEQGFDWGARRAWDDVLAYDLSYQLPLGIEQTGLALILNSSQQADIVTKTMYSLLTPEPTNHSDFMIVFDNGRFESFLRYEREASSERKISPNIKVVNRDTLAEWLGSLNL